jgi:hypothetical protein
VKRMRMNLITFISILSLAILIFALIKMNRRRLSINRSPESWPRRFDGLFAEQYETETKLRSQVEAERSAEEDRNRLIRRASEGDLYALDLAHAKADTDLYREVLNSLVANTGGDAERLRSLAEYVVDGKVLRSSAPFSNMIIELWCNSLDRRSLHYMFCLSALSDDEPTFLKAVDAALKQWRLGRLKTVAGEDLLAMIECAYWLISSEVRASGSGFVVKQAISGVRRELAAANPRSI